MTATAGAGKASAARLDFAAFTASMFLSKVADQVLLFLVPLVVFQTTRDAGWSGLAFALEAFPRFLSFPVCGELCDRIAPVRLLRWSQLLRSAACALGAGCSAALGGVGWLIAISAVCGVLTTQGIMAREVLLPQIFERHRFEKVLAYTQTADQLGAVLGPVVAAGLLALVPWWMAVFATAVVFLLADGALLGWQRSTAAVVRPPAPTSHGWLRSLRVAAGHVWQVPGLRRLVVQAAGVNLVVGITLASSAALVTGVHAQSAGFYAGLQTAGAFTTVLVLLAIARLPSSANRLGATAFLLIVAGGLLTALSRGAIGCAIGYLLVVGFDKMFNIYLRSARQPLIPPAHYGKTTGVMALLNNLTQPLSGLALGAFAAHWGVAGVILALTACMALLGWVSLRRP